jgi:hypothetical protein
MSKASWLVVAANLVGQLIRFQGSRAFKAKTFGFHFFVINSLTDVSVLRLKQTVDESVS